jgi:SPP1 family predicted phage head-tail adaptor
MRAGNLDRRITIRQSTEVQDSYGEEIATWSDLADVWAQRLELSGAERWNAEQVVAQIACKYRIRYRTGITVLHRLMDGTKEYDIHAVLEIGRHEGLELVVSARGE